MPELTLIPDSKARSVGLSHLIPMLKYSRWSLLTMVKKLSIKELDYKSDFHVNSIGTLLFHIAACEAATMPLILNIEGLTADELAFWSPGFPDNLDSSTIKGHEIAYYVELLTKVRESTLEQLVTQNDLWLCDFRVQANLRYNNFFKLFHLLEEELHHRGQIRQIISYLKRKEI